MPNTTTKAALAELFATGERLISHLSGFDYIKPLATDFADALTQYRQALADEERRAGEREWETPCPKREDKIHCECWYDGNPCCGCGENPYLDEENANRIVLELRTENARLRERVKELEEMFAAEVAALRWCEENAVTAEYYADREPHWIVSLPVDGKRHTLADHGGPTLAAAVASAKAALQGKGE